MAVATRNYTGLRLSPAASAATARASAADQQAYPSNRRSLQQCGSRWSVLPHAGHFARVLLHESCFFLNPGVPAAAVAGAALGIRKQR